MQANLLFIDGISTNRIALNARLSSAWYQVSVVSALKDAQDQMRSVTPDLIVIGASVLDCTPIEAIAKLRGKHKLSGPPVLALSDDPAERDALLQAGADDVLSYRCPDRFLQARIRSLLRAYSAAAEWRMRDDTTRALGFAEPKVNFQQPAPVFFVHNAAMDPAQLALALGANLQMSTQAGLSVPSTGLESVIALSLDDPGADAGLNLLADLRARPETRHAAILVITPLDRHDLAAQALDMGADDTVIGQPGKPELRLRARRLLERKRIADQLRASVRSGVEASLADPLTGLYNRRYAIPHLERLGEQARLGDKSLAVMIADLDHFKQINDWHGHAAGDAVLIETARRLKANLRPADLLARIGGEEFLIAMPGADRTSARQAALRLCRRIAETSFAVEGKPDGLAVTISIGLALSDTAGFDPDELMRRADRALYRAKKSGRNRYMLAQRDAA